MMPLFHVTSKQFTIRPFRPSDAAAIRKNIQDRAIFENTLHIPKPYRLKHAQEHIAKNLRQYRQKKPIGIGYVIEVDGEAAGAIGFRFRGHKGELGYWLAKKHRGRGITTAAVKLFVDHLFTAYNLKRIEAFVFTHNPASGQVLRKAGFAREGLLRRKIEKKKKLLDEELYAIVR